MNQARSIRHPDAVVQRVERVPERGDPVCASMVSCEDVALGTPDSPARRARVSYSYVMEGIQGKHFVVQKPDARIAGTEEVEAYVLAEEWHPLIDAAVLGIVNKAFLANDRRIRFGAIRIQPDGTDLYSLEMPASE